MESGPKSILDKETIGIVDLCDSKGCYKKNIPFDFTSKGYINNLVV